MHVRQCTTSLRLGSRLMFNRLWSKVLRCANFFKSSWLIVWIIVLMYDSCIDSCSLGIIWIFSIDSPYGSKNENGLGWLVVSLYKLYVDSLYLEFLHIFSTPTMANSMNQSFLFMSWTHFIGTNFTSSKILVGMIVQLVLFVHESLN